MNRFDMVRFGFRVLPLCAVTIVGGCAAQSVGVATSSIASETTETEAEIYQQTTKSDDVHVGVVRFAGPKLNAPNGAYNTQFSLALARNIKDGKVQAVVLGVSAASFGNKHFRAAYSMGSQLPLTTVKTDIGICSPLGCAVTQTVLVELSEALLARSTEGLDVKVIGNADERIVSVPAAYIRGFLRKANEVGKTDRAATARQ